MSRIDKSISTARGMAVVILTVAVTCGYLAYAETLSLYRLSEVRKLFSHWLVYDRLRIEYEAWRELEDRKTAFDVSQSWKTGAVEYYKGFGWVSVKREPSGFFIAVSNAPQTADDPLLFATIPDLRPWSRRISTPPQLDFIQFPKFEAKYRH